VAGHVQLGDIHADDVDLFEEYQAKATAEVKRMLLAYLELLMEGELVD
jgi:hypothetical protein